MPPRNQPITIIRGSHSRAYHTHSGGDEYNHQQSGHAATSSPAAAPAAVPAHASSSTASTPAPNIIIRKPVRDPITQSCIFITTTSGAVHNTHRNPINTFRKHNPARTPARLNDRRSHPRSPSNNRCTDVTKSQNPYPT